MAIIRLYNIVCDGCDEEAPGEPAFAIREAAVAARAAGWYVCLAGSEKRWTRKGDALCPSCDRRPRRSSGSGSV